MCVSEFLCECVCANAVLVSRLPAMPLASDFFKSLWFSKNYEFSELRFILSRKLEEGS